MYKKIMYKKECIKNEVIKNERIKSKHIKNELIKKRTDPPETRKDFDFDSAVCILTPRCAF